MPCREFSDVFDAVRDGLFDYGIVPVENTLGGIVGPGQLDPHQHRPQDRRGHGHARLALPPRRARDRPPRDPLGLLPLARPSRSAATSSRATSSSRRPYYDTAGAARMISQERPQGHGGHRQPLRRRDLRPRDHQGRDPGLAEQPHPLPRPRQGGLGPARATSAPPSSRPRTRPAPSSRPSRSSPAPASTSPGSSRCPNKPGDYAIFLDFDGSEADPRVAAAHIRGGQAAARDFRVLGCYIERKL